MTDPDPDGALVAGPPAPITRDEVRHVLGLVMLVDGRHAPGDATITEWLRLATAARWTHDEAVDAVRAHYARSTDYLMPGHITAHIRAQRENRRGAWTRRSPAATAASDEVRSGAMAAMRRTFAESRRRRQEAAAQTDPEETPSA